MTGTLKKHRASYAAEGVRLWYDNANNRSVRNATGVGRHGIRCPTIKDLEGTEWHYIYASRGYTSNYAYNAEIAGYNERSFVGLIALATEDTLDNWSIDDWQINSIGSTSQSQGCMFNDVVMQQVYTVNIINNSVDHYEQNIDPVFVPNKFYEKDGNNYILLTELPQGDHYDPNDNPTYAANTFYELVDEDYILLTSEEAPDDWENTYTDYYVFVQGVEWERDYANYYVFVAAEDIVVTCIRFRKPYCLCTESQWDYNGSSSQYTEKHCLAYSYYLDEPITISPGNSRTVTVKFSPTED